MIYIGVDIGTTTITALALDAANGEVVASQTVSNNAEITPEKERSLGRSEWDANRIVDLGFEALSRLTSQLDANRGSVAAIGLTGQQHGGLLLDATHQPMTPLIGWQDRRGDEPFPASPERTHVEQARRLAGEQAAARAGCRLASGFTAVTLFWMKQNGCLPRDGEICFVAEYFGSALTDSRPQSELTMAASSGVVDVARRQWDAQVIAALDLDAVRWPPLIEADQALGGLAAGAARRLGLRSGIPVFPALGDNQSSFLGSVADPDHSFLINVGTGGQVAALVEAFGFYEGMETRPFPFAGHLLVIPGLAGGRAYALLEQFFRQVGERLFGVSAEQPLFDRMNELAAATPDAAGLTCEPLFAGTRSDPTRRGSVQGLSPENFTPEHMTRALLEGAAEVFLRGWRAMQPVAAREFTEIVGAGNGVRRNPVLVDCLRRRFELPVKIPLRPEEAAVGAALTASVGSGQFADYREASRRLLRYGG